METLIEILKQIRKFSEWIDRDSIDELKIYLDEIRESSVDAIKMLNEKAEPIRLGLILKGEDAREFEERMKNPKVTKEQVNFIKEAIEVFGKHPF